MSKFFGNSDIVLFQGDSVTDCNRDRDDITSLGNGYPALVKAIYNTLFPTNNTVFINKGVSGARVRDLLERYEGDIYDIQPTFISIFIGINDTWRAFDSNDPCPIERFTSEYTQLLEKIKHDLPAIKIMLIEPFVLHTSPDRKEWHTDLDPKREAVRELANQYADFHLPIQTILNRKTKFDFTAAELAQDGVHPSPAGHAVIAAEFLKILDVL